VLLGGSHRVLSEVYEPSREAVYVASVGLLPGLQGMVTVLDGSSIPASESSTIDVPVGESPDAFAVVPSGNEEAQGTAMIWVANALSGTISVLASPPEITYFAATPSTVDLGSSTTVGVTYQGGAGNSTVSFLGLPPGCSPSGQLEFNCTPSAAGSYSLTVKVTDSLGVSVNATTSLTVLHALSVRTTFTPSTFPHLDVGVPWVGTAVASNGLPPYVYQWSFGDGTGASTPGATHAYTSPGDYVVTTEVRDAIGVTSNSTALVVVAPRPTVAVTLSPGNETDVDLPITLQAVVSGGTGVTSESWTFGDSNEWTGPNATHAWTRAGNYTVAFSYTDALGVSANVSVSVVVHPPLGAKFSSENASAASPGAPGTPIPFSASVTGGTPPYTVQWNWGDGSYGTGLRTNHSYASPGTYSVGVTLKDAVGTNVTASFQVVIAENSSSSGSVPSAGGGFTAGLFLGLIFGGAVGAIVLFFAARRKTEHPPAGPVPPYVPP
jgi:PKD repeat protein